MEALGLAWRDAVFVVVGLVAIYVVVMVVRLLRVGRIGAAGPARDGERRAPSLAEAGVQTPEGWGTVTAPLPVTPAAPEPAATDEAAVPNRLSRRIGREAAPRRVDPKPDHTEEFAAELARSNYEVEVQQLRRDALAMRQQIAALEQEMLQLKARSNVSPLYSEAMTLAQRGVPADGIAGQCGISLGEAELVAALARGETDESSNPIEDRHGETPGPGRRTGTHG